MEIIKPSALTSKILNTGPNGVPIFFCTVTPRTKKKIDDAGYEEVRVNLALSKKLLAFAPDERPKHVEESLRAILDYHVPIYITDFEMLFDPRYEIDVIKLFCEKARITNVVVHWPGKFSNDHLTYSDHEKSDYHEYDCSAYLIRIVQ